MDAALLGIVLDSSVLIAAERRKLTPAEVVESVRKIAGEIPIMLCAISVAEIAHGIYRANMEDLRHRRRAFLDELKATVPVHPITAATGEMIAKIGAEQAAQGINLPLGDLIIGASAIELGYGVATGNLRDFARIPGLRVMRL
ncbi:MAG: PIN domain-containing protein [Bryobacteraceae bacterium]|jgi:predicted nucleic acid-binding protein